MAPRRRRVASPASSSSPPREAGISLTSLALAAAALALTIGVLLAPPPVLQPLASGGAPPPPLAFSSELGVRRPPFGGGVGLRPHEQHVRDEEREGPERERAKKRRASRRPIDERSLSRSLRTTHPTQPAPPPPPPSHGTWDAIDGDWIVRFTAYKPADQHVAALAASLGPTTPATWAWVDRANPAAALPTDFGVVRLGAGSPLTKVCD